MAVVTLALDLQLGRRQPFAQSGPLDRDIVLQSSLTTRARRSLSQHGCQLS